jgi:hypothetical protein
MLHQRNNCDIKSVTSDFRAIFSHLESAGVSTAVVRQGIRSFSPQYRPIDGGGKSHSPTNQTSARPNLI